MKQNKSVTEPKCPWGKAWTSGADVQAVWRRYGWVPPSEYRNDFLFKQNREAKGEVKGEVKDV